MTDVIAIIVLTILYFLAYLLQYNLQVNQFSRNQREISSTRLLETTLVVTAHPDDECMFFAPTILSLLEKNVDVHLLCLTSGTQTFVNRNKINELF